MSKKRSRIALLLTMGLLALLAAGCGTTDSPDQELSFAMSGQYPPFNFYNDEGELDGFDVDVGKELASRMGYTYKGVTTDWDGIIGGLRGRKYDGILGSMAITAEREEQVNFTDPYYYSGAQLIVRADSGIESPRDLPNDALIGVSTGETYAQDAISLVGEDRVRYYSDPVQSMQDLKAGRIQGIITDRIVGLNAYQEMGMDFQLAGETLRTEKMGIAFHKDDVNLLQEANQALKEMRDDGTLAQISEKWFKADITNP